MDIYSFYTFNLTKVLLTAQALKSPYQLHLFDITKGEHKSAEHKQRHPLGKVPVVEIEGVNYFESNAICRLLAERSNNQLYGNTPELRAVVNQWIEFSTQHIGRWLTVVFFEQNVKPVLFGGETNLSAIDEAETYLAEQLPVIESQLTKHKYLASDDFTIADIIAFSLFSTTDISGVQLSKYPQITQWIKTIKAKDCYIAAMADLPQEDMFSHLRTA